MCLVLCLRQLLELVEVKSDIKQGKFCLYINKFSYALTLNNAADKQKKRLTITNTSRRMIHIELTPILTNTLLYNNLPIYLFFIGSSYTQSSETSCHM